MRLVQKRFVIIVIVLLVGSVLFVFSNDILFAFQRQRLKKLGCSISNIPVQWKAGITVHGCEKFWVHRVDSYERLLKLNPYFAGLETDIVFDTSLKKFRVYHPPVPPGDLFAERYFDFNKTAGKQLWLDVKDLDPGSFPEAKRFFENADSLYHLKKNVIIESSQIDFVNELSLLGFTVSYLVSPEMLDGNEIDKVSLKLLPAVKFVSQEDKYVERLKKKFPGKQIITWAISFNNYFDLSHFRTLLADSSVAVVLINIKSNGYR